MGVLFCLFSGLLFRLFLVGFVFCCAAALAILMTCSACAASHNLSEFLRFFAKKIAKWGLIYEPAFRARFLLPSLAKVQFPSPISGFDLLSWLFWFFSQKHGQLARQIVGLVRETNAGSFFLPKPGSPKTFQKSARRQGQKPRPIGTIGLQRLCPLLLPVSGSANQPANQRKCACFCAYRLANKYLQKLRL